jgi:hypothetical protein
MEILKMVADKVINVEEAERLLRALDDGDRRKHESPRGGPGRGHGLGGALEEVGEVLRHAFQEAMAGAGIEIPDDDEGGPGGPVAERRFAVEAGTELVVRDVMGPFHAGGETVVVGGPGDTLELEGEAAGLRVFRRPGRVVVHRGRGPLRVVVPAVVGAVRVVTFTGNVRVEGVAGTLAVRSMGGTVTARGVRTETKVWTAGGDVDVELAPAWNGDSSVVSPGGSVTVRVARETAGKVRASTVGGKIEVEDGVGTVRRTRAVAKDRVEVDLHGEAAGATFTVKTMGGNVRVVGA